MRKKEERNTGLCYLDIGFNRDLAPVLQNWQVMCLLLKNTAHMAKKWCFTIKYQAELTSKNLFRAYQFVWDIWSLNIIFSDRIIHSCLKPW